jgi:NADPH:quinone reductase-like Zn-dependent oxidoreductase
MRAAGVRAFGGPVEELELPEPPKPGRGEVLVDVIGAGIGNWDDLVRTGAWDVGIAPPMALGVEAAGTVRAIGTGVSRFAKGDEVMLHSAPLRDQGTWAEQLLVGEPDLAAKPAALAWSVAAVLPVPLLTAAQVVALVAAAPGAEVLVHGAGGVTGGLLVAMAAHAGYRVFATCSPASADGVRRSGAAETVDYHRPTWQAELQASVPGGFAAVVGAVRGGSASLLPLVTGGGQLVTITGDPPAGERGIAISDAYVAPDGPLLARTADQVAQMGIRIPIAGTVGLLGVADALRWVARGAGGGAWVADPRQ